MEKTQDGFVMEFVIDDKPCPYLKGKVAKTKYHLINNCGEKECKSYVEHGWRRFGKLFFTPICDGCDECKSMRIDVRSFQMSRTMKRILKKNADTRVIIRRPTLTSDHLNLYEKYHNRMNEKKAWNTEGISSSDYYNSFVDGYGTFGYEFLYIRDNKLIGVALVDILPNAMSSIYCFYDHDYEKYSIGTFSVLKQIEYAKKMEIDYLYLGYWVEENNSLSYKSKFKPHEILIEGFSFGEETVWR